MPVLLSTAQVNPSISKIDFRAIFQGISLNSMVSDDLTSLPTKIFRLVTSENTCITSRISVLVKFNVIGKLSYKSAFKLASIGVLGSCVLIIFFLFKSKLSLVFLRVGPNLARFSTFSFCSSTNLEICSLS